MTKSQHRTYMVGLALGLALFLIRLEVSRTFGDLLLSLAYLLAECGIVYMLEKKARRMEPEIEALHVYDRVHGQAANCALAARDDLERRQGHIDRADATVAEIERAFELDLELGDQKVLTMICVNAIRSGYLAGIAANVAKVGGLTTSEVA